jgi:hypothetical protein
MPIVQFMKTILLWNMSGVQAIVPIFPVLSEILTHLARLAQNSLKAPLPGTMACTLYFP